MKRLHLRPKPSRAQTPVDVTSGDPRILVNGGYKPDTVIAQLGHPVRITFHRADASPCSEEVVFADLGVKAFLPLHEDVTVELHPQHAGDYEFTCGMAMLRGRLIVRPIGEEPPANERKQS